MQAERKKMQSGPHGLAFAIREKVQLERSAVRGRTGVAAIRLIPSRATTQQLLAPGLKVVCQSSSSGGIKNVPMER